MEKKQYYYDGVVLEFERVISNRWSGSTYAKTPNKAKSNLAYRFKKETGRSANSKISLPGKIYEIG